MSENLLENVHEDLPDPTPSGKTIVTRGKYSYYHYNCDGYQDAVRIMHFCFDGTSIAEIILFSGL